MTMGENFARAAGTKTGVFRGGLFALALGDFLAAVIPARADMVAQMHLARRRLDSQRRRREEIMSAMHTALGRGLFVLLDSHTVAP